MAERDEGIPAGMERFVERCLRVLDGVATDAERERLEGELLASAGHRALFVWLSVHCAEVQTACEEAAAGRDERRRGVLARLWVGGGSALAAVLLLGVMVWWSVMGVSEPVREITVWGTGQRAAMTAWVDGDGLIERGPVFYGAGDVLRVESGVARVETAEGVELMVDGPAEVGFEAGLGVALRSGRLVAWVPKAATGFAVTAGDVRVVDLGTAFGVSVDGETGRVSTRVFEGKVRLESGSARALVRAGEGAWTDEVGTVQRGLRGGAGMMGYVRSLPRTAWGAAIAEAGPVVYYSFDRDSGGMAGHEFGGYVPGLRYEGLATCEREGASGYLRLEGDVAGCESAGALVGWDGVAEGYTVVLLIRPREVGSQNIVTATNELGADRLFGPQVRIRPDGQLEHVAVVRGPAGPGYEVEQSSRVRVARGVWSAVAITAEGGGRMRMYVDGVEAAAPVSLDGGLYLGYSDLVVGGSSGRMRRDVLHHMAPFEGDVDELAVFGRALHEEEIAELHALLLGR